MTLKRLVQCSIVFAFIVILMGAFTRLSDAGLGCPDWPGCYGHLAVPSETHELDKAKQLYPELTVESHKAWLEMIHRYLAGILGLMILAILILCWRQPSAPKKLSAAIAALVIFQALLGMWTVTMKLMPIVVMGHLLGGFSLISLLLLLYWRLTPLQLSHTMSLSPSIKLLAWLALGTLIIQIMLGGWTSSNYAALACTTLPFCEGDWQSQLNWAKAFSPFQGDHISFEYGVLDWATRMTIHVSHRVWAIVTSIFIIWLGLKLLFQHQGFLRTSAIIMLGLLVVQVSLGISNIVFHLPLSVATAHNGVAALLLLSVVTITFGIYQTAQEDHRSSL
ncbi:heme A synthase [Parashewanella curva]|uniref:Heme A synthase n=1 Tax=Parashewanella curva TaxID=2338552 RepID=A0A3L8PYP6_9GAMM|nr:COX15/CtaA family protein [Parashewanella curva]RLV59202.1 heme A synthase [Parashewanella curva]